MPRKPITEEMKQEIINEANSIIQEFVKDKTPEFHIKLGGWTATANKRLNLISLNYYVWRKLLLAQKRMLLIHEYIHLLGFNHSGVKSYVHALDILTLKAYLKIYGKDDAWNEFEILIQKVLNKLNF